MEFSSSAPRFSPFSPPSKMSSTERFKRERERERERERVCVCVCKSKLNTQAMLALTYRTGGRRTMTENR